MNEPDRHPLTPANPGPEGPGRPIDVPEAQAADDPRGDDEVRRELGAGDGDDPPPCTGDEPSPR